MERRRFSQTMASEWQTAFVVSHKMPWRTLLTVIKNYTKSLENCQTFSSRPTPRPRPNIRDQNQDFMIQDQDQNQDFHFCPRGASRPRPWSRGLHHCTKLIFCTYFTYADQHCTTATSGATDSVVYAVRLSLRNVCRSLYAQLTHGNGTVTNTVQSTTAL